METEGSSPYSQQPATYPNPQPDRSSLSPASSVSKIHFNIISPIFNYNLLTEFSYGT